MVNLRLVATERRRSAASGRRPVDPKLVQRWRRWCMRQHSVERRDFNPVGARIGSPINPGLRRVVLGNGTTVTASVTNYGA
jgi:hypothetical protein